VTDPDPRREVPARERILDAAEELFAEHGYDRTSAARLARAAAVPQGLVFYHFGTKENLLLTLVRERASSTLAETISAVATGDPHRDVAELWRQLRSRLGTPNAMQRIMLREINTHPELAEHARKIVTAVVEQVARQLADLAGNSDGPTPQQLTAARLLTVTAAVADLPYGGSGVDLEPDAIAHLLVDGLAGDLRTP
jgi:AcrR family transcriptional regulator